MVKFAEGAYHKLRFMLINERWCFFVTDGEWWSKSLFFCTKCNNSEKLLPINFAVFKIYTQTLLVSWFSLLPALELCKTAFAYINTRSVEAGEGVGGVGGGNLTTP